MKIRCFNFMLCLLCTQSMLFATHNRSGEILFTQLDELRIRATVITYTRESSLAADRDSLNFCWGDGTCEWIQRINGQGSGEPIGFDTKKNVYEATHIYTDLGNYKLAMTDPNRNSGILNIANGNSVNVAFHLETEVQLKDLNFNQINSSPVLMVPPIDLAFVGQPFIHVPNAFDVDGDSIAYELIVPLQAEGLEVPDYQFPNEVGSGSNSFSINPETGVVNWTNPTIIGEYNVAILIKSYRDGVEIDRIIRDMQIRVEEGGDPPASFETQGFPQNVVNAVGIGDTVRIQMLVPQFDPFLGIQISATFGLDVLFPDATTFATDIGDGTASAEFTWVVEEAHVREQAYQLVIKTERNFAEYGPADFAVFRFKIGETVSLTATPQRFDFQIFPNPVRNNRIYLTEKLEGPAQYSIYTIQGQMLQRGTLPLSTASIDLRALPRSTYLLRLEVNGKIGTRTFVIE
ncbi:MAG: T9SS type A sorting domain-containing protein [Bacteroidota bacterium]